jgi:hypothetical protein
LRAWRTLMSEAGKKETNMSPEVTEKATRRRPLLLVKEYV